MRISPTPPAKCTGCYQAHPQMPHVDFNSAFEGPLIDPSNPRAGHVEWLVLCEDCIRRASNLLPERADEYNALRDEIAELRRQLEVERQYSAKVEDALQHRPQQPKRKPQRKAAA